MFGASGVEGEIRVGASVAWRLGAWTLVHDPPTLGSRASTIRAAVMSRNAFWSTQPASEIRLRMGEAWWCWPTPTVLDSEPWLMATVHGDPEIRG